MTAHTRSLGRLRVAHRAVAWPDEKLAVVVHLAERNRDPFERVFAAVYEIVCTYFQPLHTMEEPTVDTLTTAAREAIMLCLEHPLLRTEAVLSLGVSAVCGQHVVIAQVGDCQLARWNGASLRKYSTTVRAGEDFVVSGTDLAELNLSERAEQATTVVRPYVQVLTPMPHESILLYRAESGDEWPSDRLQGLLQQASRSTSSWFASLREVSKQQGFSCVLIQRGWREFRPVEMPPIQIPMIDWEGAAARGEIPMEWIDERLRVFLETSWIPPLYVSGPVTPDAMACVIDEQARMVTAETLARELIPWLTAWGYATHARVIWQVAKQGASGESWAHDDAVGMDWTWRAADGWGARVWWGPLARGLYRLREMGCPLIASCEHGLVLRLETRERAGV